MLSLEALYTNKGGNGRKGIILEDKGKMKVPKGLLTQNTSYTSHLKLSRFPVPSEKTKLAN